MGSTSSEIIEDLFTKYFQRRISLTINNQVYKKGKFLLIKNNVINNNYFYDLFIERDKKIDCIKVPFPFSYEEYADEGLLYFDYRLKTLFPEKNKYINVGNLVNTISLDNKSKLIDSVLEIQFE